MKIWTTILIVTQGSVRQCVANAANDPTYLLADVEIVKTYKVYKH